MNRSSNPKIEVNSQPGGNEMARANPVDPPAAAVNGHLPGRPRREGFNILIVDDDAWVRAVLAAVVLEEGYKVFEAADGSAALGLLERQKIDAVMTDALMPVMDGYQLCHRLRGDTRFRDLPVIVFSGALVSPESEALASDLGAVRFLRKPAPVDTISRALCEVLMEAEARRIEARWSQTPKFGPEEKERHLVELLDKQNRDAQEMTERLLEAHHKLLVLTRALEESEKELREKNAQLEEDMRMARETHMALMPRSCPSFPSGAPLADSALQFHRRFAPKGVVSGDFYDFSALSETNAGVFICDVMGHGVGAALVTAVIRGMLVEMARANSDPSEVLAEINRALVPIMRHAGAPMFASAFYMTADAASGEIRFANAGHPEPFVVRRDLGQIERIGSAAHGPALGLMEESSYQTGTRTLAQHDLVMMFTDGIFEVDGPDERLFGEKRLLGAVRKRIQLPADQLFDELLQEVREYSRTNQFDDDVCLLGMEVDHLCRKAGTANCQ
jgi:serine phosphatase RsbU (regulator of sigma subunit)